MLTKALDFVMNYKKWFIIGAVLVASHGAMYGTGYLHATQKAAAEQVIKADKRTSAAVAAVVKHEAKAQVERIEVRVRDIKREQMLTAQIDSLQAERDALKDVLNANPDPDPAVFLRGRDVCLLDDAARGDRASGPQGVPGAACLAAGQEQAASDVSLRQFVGTEIDIRLQYRELAARHDMLVDWVERELIQPQLADQGALDHSDDK